MRPDRLRWALAAPEIRFRYPLDQPAGDKAELRLLNDIGDGVLANAGMHHGVEDGLVDLGAHAEIEQRDAQAVQELGVGEHAQPELPILQEGVTYLVIDLVDGSHAAASISLGACSR